MERSPPCQVRSLVLDPPARFLLFLARQPRRPEATPSSLRGLRRHGQKAGKGESRLTWSLTAERSMPIPTLMELREGRISRNGLGMERTVRSATGRQWKVIGIGQGAGGMDHQLSKMRIHFAPVQEKGYYIWWIKF